MMAPKDMTEIQHGPPRTGLSALRVLPIAVLAGGLVAFFAFGVDHYLSYVTLQTHRDVLIAWVAGHRALAALCFIGVYVVIAAFMLPAGVFATIIGGFLFGPALATLLVITGGTAGAVVLFVAARFTGIGAMLEAKAGPGLKKMEQGFRRNAAYYLLFLRLVPLFPFWLVNLVPAFLGVRLSVYVSCTFIGIIPGTFVYALLGNGLGQLLDEGKSPDLETILELQYLGPIIALAVLALVPILYKRFISGRGPRAPS